MHSFWIQEGHGSSWGHGRVCGRPNYVSKSSDLMQFSKTCDSNLQ